MKLLILIFFLFVYINANSQVGPIRNWVDSEVKYTDSKGKSVMITNSLPKGGGVADINGKKIGYRVFWTRIRNESVTPINLLVKFNKINFLNSKESPIKIVLPKDNMRHEKIQLFDYGLTNLQSLLNDESNQFSTMQKKISPKEDYFFYVTVFVQDSGTARAAIILKDKNLFYKFAMDSDKVLIPCGSIYFKN